MNKLFIIAIAGVILLSTIAIANSNSYQEWFDLIEEINARWAKAYAVGVAEAYQQGKQDKVCGSSPTQIEYIEVYPTSGLESCGDANGDGVIDDVDYAYIEAQWGNPGTADFNGDGIVDAGDYTTWADNFGQESC